MVKWFAQWRKYVFQAYPSTVWDETCLAEVSMFLTAATRDHKEAR
jgi:hypothetical protein